MAQHPLLSNAGAQLLSLHLHRSPFNTPDTMERILHNHSWFKLLKEGLKWEGLAYKKNMSYGTRWYTKGVPKLVEKLLTHIVNTLTAMTRGHGRGRGGEGGWRWPRKEGVGRGASASAFVFQPPAFAPASAQKPAAGARVAV